MMSETDKKSKRRKERGLNVRVVQEQKSIKSENVRVNTRTRRNTSKKNTSQIKKKEQVKVNRKTSTVLVKQIEETKVKEARMRAKDTVVKQKKADDKPQVRKKTSETKDFAWKEEEALEEFETLKLHTDKKKTSSKIILRDVAKEKPSTVNRLNEEAFKAEEVLPKSAVKTTKKPAAKSAKLSAKEIKEHEIEKAISTAARLPQTSTKRSRRERMMGNFGAGKAVLAIACLSTAIFAIIYFVNMASTNVSLKVAAMQSGIEAVYPSYTPRGYMLSDVTSSSGKIVLGFKSENGSYTITEEQTTWNSDGLLGNFIRPNYEDDYTIVKEQGLTLYMGDNWEAWVNGGMLYKLTVDSGELTKKQMKTIATSL